MSERIRNSEFSKPEIPEQETELSPEVIEMVMEKVQDIKKDGIAFTSIGSLNKNDPTDQKKLHSILENGILGGRSEFPHPREKATWTQYLKQKGRGPKAASIFFNISGRSYNTHPTYGGHPLRVGDMGFYRGVTILFDLDKFHEVGLPLEKDFGEGMNQLDPMDSAGHEAVLDPYTFWVTQPENRHFWIEKFFREIGISQEDMQQAWQPGSEALKAASKSGRFSVSPEGLIEPDGEYGFVLPYRIAPKLFRGIVFYKIEDGEAVKYTMLDAYKKSPELLVPIYDNGGDLTWPKKMIHREIREREEEK